MEKCSSCGKPAKDTGLVWYSEDIENYLCRGCMISWGRNKDNKRIQDKYKDAKPTTKAWHKKCDELQKEFDKWLKLRKSQDKRGNSKSQPKREGR